MPDQEKDSNTMAEEQATVANQADAQGLSEEDDLGVDIDALLNETQQSLDAVEGNLDDDSTDDGQTSSGAVEVPDPEIDDVAAALAALESEMEALNADVSQDAPLDQAAAEPGVADGSESDADGADAALEALEDTQEVSNGNDLEDLLASLGAEVDQLNADTKAHIEHQDEPEYESGTASGQDDIDDLLASFGNQNAEQATPAPEVPVEAEDRIETPPAAISEEQVTPADQDDFTAALDAYDQGKDPIQAAQASARATESVESVESGDLVQAVEAVGQDDVDSLLGGLEQELQGVNDAEQLEDAVDDVPVDDIEDESVDEQVATLLEEEADLSGDVAAVEQEPQEGSVEDAGDIDSMLAGLSAEMDGGQDEVDAITAARDETADDLPAELMDAEDLAVEAPGIEAPEAADEPETYAEVESVAVDEEAAEISPENQVEPEPEPAADVDTVIEQAAEASPQIGADMSDDERVVMEEIDAVQSKDKTKATAGNAPVMPKPEFSRPERMLISGLEAANKPFGFVPDPLKDTLGLVAVVTVIVSTVAAGALLLF